MENILICKGIEKSFGKGEQGQKVLDKISVSIKEGEFISIMGPSGSGKSTLLFTLSGLDTVDCGSINFLGKEITTLSEKEFANLRRREMGFVFQQPTLLRNLNLIDNIMLPSLKDNMGNTNTLTEKSKKLMEQTGISSLEKRSITQVSGGQLQRAGICRALMNDPKIIFADEPTGSLNSKSSDEIMEIFREINHKGTAIMLVTHDAKVAVKTNKVLFMKDGVIENELIFNSNHSHNERLERVRFEFNRLGI